MNNHKKKMIAPVVVSVLSIIYYIFYFGFIISVTEGVFRYFFGILPFVFAIVTIKVCIERINEIKKGEEDDISNY